MRNVRERYELEESLWAKLLAKWVKSAGGNPHHMLGRAPFAHENLATGGSVPAAPPLLDRWHNGPRIGQTDPLLLFVSPLHCPSDR